MKITFEGEALEFAALVNEVSESSAPAIETDTNEIVVAFKKMTLKLQLGVRLAGKQVSSTLSLIP